MDDMLIKRVRSAAAALVMSAMAFGSAVQPVKADTTTTLIITAAAAIGLMTAINVAQKNAKARQLVGYLPDGSQVYADGHVVARNGQTWYPGNYGQNIACNGQQCYVTGGNVGYGGQPYGQPYGYGGGQPYGYGGGQPYGYGGGQPYGYGGGQPYGYGGGQPYAYGGQPYGYGGAYPAGYNGGGYYGNGSGTGLPAYPLPPAPAPRIRNNGAGNAGGTSRSTSIADPSLAPPHQRGKRNRQRRQPPTPR
jgi:hypothetical protein